MDHVRSHEFVKACGGDITQTWPKPRLPRELLLTVGGQDDKNRPTDVIETYNSRTHRWVTQQHGCERGRVTHGVVLVGENIFVLGGRDGQYRALNTVRRLDLETLQWSKEARMKNKRASVSACVLSGYIYAIGGNTFSLLVYLLTYAIN